MLIESLQFSQYIGLAKRWWRNTFPNVCDMLPLLQIHGQVALAKLIVSSWRLEEHSTSNLIPFGCSKLCFGRAAKLNALYWIAGQQLASHFAKLFGAWHVLGRTFYTTQYLTS